MEPSGLPHAVVIGERFFRVHSFRGMRREKFRAFVAAAERGRPWASPEPTVASKFWVDVMTFFSEATGAVPSEVESSFRAESRAGTKMLDAMLTICDFGQDGGYDWNEFPSSKSESLPN